jgi:hypothetical protein
MSALLVCFHHLGGLAAVEYGMEGVEDLLPSIPVDSAAAAAVAAVLPAFLP